MNENENIGIPKSIGQKKTVLKEKLIGLSAYIKNFQINDASKSSRKEQGIQQQRVHRER